MPKVTDAFETEVRAAFPDMEWDPDRLMALKEAIKICVDTDYGDEEAAEDEGDSEEGLAMVFGR